MDCVILAGGLGTRMHPVTRSIPKALIPVAGVPFVEHQLRWLASEGVDQVLFLIGYKGAMLRDIVGDGRRFGLAVDYVDEGEDLRGTGGALRLALDQGALPEAFLILYGDSYLPISVAPVWHAFLASGDPALMTVLRNEGRFEKSNASFRRGRVELYDKGSSRSDLSYIDYGLSAFRRDVVAEIPAVGKYDLADLLHRLSVDGRLAGFEVQERFYEVGSPAGLADLEALLKARRPAVFLDRDGVLVRALVRRGKPYSARHPDDLEILPGAAETCAALRRAGLLTIVVTNQPDVARGDLALGDLSALHDALFDRIPVDAVLFCPHDDRDGCLCRKPAPGLLIEAADRFGISLSRSVMVGDRWRDIEAGARAGCRTVFVEARYRERRPEAPDLTVGSLAEALQWILEATKPEMGST